MKRIAALALVVASGSIGAFVLSALAAPAPAPALCLNPLVHEPVLVYDMAGGTLLGPIYRHLAVYDDGHAIASRTTDSSDPGAAATNFLTAAEVAQLRDDLKTAGAGVLCDDPSSVSDVPLQTISFFRGTTDASVHTFSYWLGAAPYDGVDNVITALYAAKFPGL